MNYHYEIIQKIVGVGCRVMQAPTYFCAITHPASRIINPKQNSPRTVPLEFDNIPQFHYITLQNLQGEVSEWLKVHAWKACVG
jgi:hypothetical protein